LREPKREWPPWNGKAWVWFGWFWSVSLRGVIAVAPFLGFFELDQKNSEIPGMQSPTNVSLIFNGTVK
tara:strand:+ start:348 stop:551 length:204 start_codon:yes stop_codon:yes gene_type:complete